MNPPSEQTDPAAVFACALSLREACHRATHADPQLNLSECFQGMDNLMRVVMSIGTRFETWACANLSFDELDDVWPYLLEDKFGGACLQVLAPQSLEGFDDDDCLRVALNLRLPIRIRESLHVPLSVTADNPVPGSAFVRFRIQTVRHSPEDDQILPFTSNDDPFDPNWGDPYFSLYGVAPDGFLEHIADRRNYGETFDLARKLAPGIAFNPAPVATYAAFPEMGNPRESSV